MLTLNNKRASFIQSNKSSYRYAVAWPRIYLPSIVAKNVDDNKFFFGADALIPENRDGAALSYPYKCVRCHASISAAYNQE